MKTIALLHREELTYLYTSLSKYLDKELNIVHIAYCDKEVLMLQKNGIYECYNYTRLLSEVLDSMQLDEKIIDLIDKLFIENTDGRFNLNASLQSDRGYALLDYNQTLILAQANYTVWCDIFQKHKIDIMLHEPCSLFFNHLATVMCKAQGGAFLYHCVSASEGNQISYLNIINDDYTCLELNNNLEYFNSNQDKIDHERCNAFIEKFRANYEIFLQNLQPKVNILGYRIDSLKRNISSCLRRNRYDIIKNNIDYWLNKQNLAQDIIANLHNYKKHKIKFEEPIKGESYYYYSFHLEPEAVVLYLGDGIYANQVKLIENIAASLPAGAYLYVKDHPHASAYRSVDDFVRLSKIPNIRLIRSSIPGKLLIKNAKGVFTINGTAGFEGLMLGKQVYCFGKSFYTKYNRVNVIQNIRDLRNVVYSNINVQYNDDNEFLSFVNAYLESLHIGLVDFFCNRAGSYNVDLEKNAMQIATDLKKYVENFEKYYSKDLKSK